MTFTRREALAFCVSTVTPAFGQARPRVAITMDDVNWEMIPADRRSEAEERLLSALSGTEAFLFAIGQNVDNEHGDRILKTWGAAGHKIGNHTYRHALLSSANAGEFEAGILQTDRVLQKYPAFRRWFRFPALKEGATPEVRDRLRSFLTQHGYSTGAVTIDASDWYYDRRLQQRLAADPGFDVNRYRQPYLAHILDRARYYDQLSRDVLGRGVAHTLLIHYNLLNSLFLPDLLRAFRENGWGVIDAEEAFADPVFERHPVIAPAGESLIWGLAKETGKFETRLRYPGEDDVYEKPLLDRLGL